jgi:hypothetical protein
LDLKGRKTDHGENCIRMNLIVCILHPILIIRVIKSRRIRWTGQGFGWEAGREETTRKT